MNSSAQEVLASKLFCEWVGSFRSFKYWCWFIDEEYKFQGFITGKVEVYYSLYVLKKIKKKTNKNETTCILSSSTDTQYIVEPGCGLKGGGRGIAPSEAQSNLTDDSWINSMAPIIHGTYYKS